MSSRFVNPFTDLGFKIIFGQPASKALLIILLNELLSGEHHIEDLTFLDKEDRSENIHDKGIIYDLYCRTSTGEYIIVEMQNRWHSHFLDRTLYYVCRAVSRQMENPSSKEVCVPDTPLEGDCGLLREEEASYGLRYRLPAVYGVFLMNFKEDGLESKFRTDTVVSDRDTEPHLRRVSRKGRDGKRGGASAERHVPLVQNPLADARRAAVRRPFAGFGLRRRGAGLLAAEKGGAGALARRGSVRGGAAGLRSVCAGDCGRFAV